jgi:hypothetical protein
LPLPRRFARHVEAVGDGVVVDEDILCVELEARRQGEEDEEERGRAELFCSAAEG